MPRKGASSSKTRADSSAIVVRPEQLGLTQVLQWATELDGEEHALVAAAGVPITTISTSVHAWQKHTRDKGAMPEAVLQQLHSAMYASEVSPT